MFREVTIKTDCRGLLPDMRLRRFRHESGIIFRICKHRCASLSLQLWHKSKQYCSGVFYMNWNWGSGQEKPTTSSVWSSSSEMWTPESTTWTPTSTSKAVSTSSSSSIFSSSVNRSVSNWQSSKLTLAAPLASNLQTSPLAQPQARVCHLKQTAWVLALTRLQTIRREATLLVSTCWSCKW